jgi:hypothetical protein
MAQTIQSANKKIDALEKENDKLKDELKHYRRSPYYLSYTTILTQVNNFCKETDVPLDINDPDNKEAFNMRWKFIQELPTLLVNLDSLREKMLPDEQREAEKFRDDSLVEGMAEKHPRRRGND